MSTVDGIFCYGILTCYTGVLGYVFMILFHSLPSCRAPLIWSRPDFLSASLRKRLRMVGNTLVSQAFTSKA